MKLHIWVTRFNRLCLFFWTKPGKPFFDIANE